MRHECGYSKAIILISSITCAERERDLGTTSISVSAIFPILRVAKLLSHCLVGMAVEREILESRDGGLQLLFHIRDKTT